MVSKGLHPIAMGAALGALLGIIEVLGHLAGGNSSINRSYLLEAALLYAICGACLGFALWVLARISRPPGWPARTNLAILCAGFLFLFVGGYVNVSVLPEIFSPRSLLISALIFLGSIGIGFAVYTILGRFSERVRQQCADFFTRPLFWLIGVLPVLLLLVVLSVAPPNRDAGLRSPAEGGNDTNVLMIVVDALRPDHMSLYGYARQTTPRLDEWASEAVVFDAAFSHAPWTKPSTATLLTALYPATHGVNPMASAVADDIDLLPELMRGNGYRTAILSANHFITPTFGFGRGVEYFYSSLPPRMQSLILGHILHQLGYRLPPVGRIVTLLESWEKQITGGAAPEGGLDAEGLTTAFQTWLDDIGDRRFFAYLHYMEPHAPYDPPAPYDRAFMPRDLAGREKVVDFPTYSGFLPFDEGTSVSSDSLNIMLALYDGSILCADHWIGGLIGDLKQRGIYEKTLILLTADHGEEFHDHGGWGHGQSLFGELLHVPLIVSGPGTERARGQRRGQVVRHVDLVPTILEQCALPPLEATPGRSLRSVISLEESADSTRLVYAEVDFGGRYARSLREGDRKVILAQSGGKERMLAFDLAEDPLETTNLIAAGVIWPGRMLSRLEQIHDIASENAYASSKIVIDEATKKKLKAIGYLN